MRGIQLKSVIWKEGKYYVAQCLNVDVSSFGKSKKSALANLNEALALYVEDTKTQKISVVEHPMIALQKFTQPTTSTIELFAPNCLGATVALLQCVTA